MTLKEAQQEVDSLDKKIRSTLLQRAHQYGRIDRRSRRAGTSYGTQIRRPVFKEGEKDNVEEEIADVLWVLLCIANQTGVDITEAFARSIEKKTKRDQTRHINNPKLSDHGE